VLLAALLLGSVAVVARAFQLQVLESEHWTARAAEQHQQRRPLPAPRGTIYDRNGLPLAAMREVLRVSVAPHEVENGAVVARRLREVLGLSEAEVRRALDGNRRWAVLPGHHPPTARERLAGLAGIHFESVLERFYPQGELGLELLGRVAADGRPLGGIELELDTLLRGLGGAQIVKRDGSGRAIPGAMLVVAEPVPGNDVYLTIDSGLQEIAEEALRQAVAQTGADGGDLVLLDRRTGELLAVASRRGEGMRHLRAATEPYEPGSTLKPFFVSALLATGAATMADSVWAENGHFTSQGRTVRDVRPHGWLTVADALSVSSNVAMAKLSERLTADLLYLYLRDFGFGSPTGLAYPSEAAGTLRRPADWSRQSKVSLAIGYELSATPLQMALAYAALANDGVLLEPRVVREVRARDGRLVASYPPRAVRRVVPADVARTISTSLAQAVETGTGREAGLGAFPVAGKTGTARVVRSGRYEDGAYVASFAGFFPAVDPQLAFLVKLDRPRGEYFGGLAAAPVMRTTLAAALAARHSPLDRHAVANATMAPTANGNAAAAASPAARESVGRTRDPTQAATTVADQRGERFVFTLRSGVPEPMPADTLALREVPDVMGMSLRDAARRLHGRGFRVRTEGSGAVVAMQPVPGGKLRTGGVVVIRARERRP
jgi:cell division protein FtsI (penicillin-binding protein 3)